jgi:hypothetical protein
MNLRLVNGDIISLTDVRPKCIDDYLNKPKRSYVIAYVHGAKPILTKQDMCKYKKETLLICSLSYLYDYKCSYMKNTEPRAGRGKHKHY